MKRAAVFAFALLLPACAPSEWIEDESPLGGEPEGAPVASETDERGGSGEESLQVWFTTPGTSAATAQDPEVDDALIAVLNAATTSLDIAVYEFNYEPVYDAVVAAHARGVAVRFVGDADEAADEGYVALVDAGVTIVSRRPKDRIMHHKFMVIDRAKVWTGSMNWSVNDVLRNNNNSLLIESEPLAARYTEEFEQMFVGRRFGNQKTANTSGSSIPFQGGTMDLVFTPQSDPIAPFLDAIASADLTIEFMTFSFTHPAIADALLEAKRRGVAVVGVLDESQARGAYSVDERLARAGLATFIDGNNNASGFSGGKVHHKVLIVDANSRSQPRVLVGSFNWSDSATNYNDENLLVLRDGDAVGLYHAQFCSVLAVAKPHIEFTGVVPDTCVDPRSRVFLNEFLPDPPGVDAGQEFVEIVNDSLFAVDLSGWTLGDAQDPARHVFAGTFVDPGRAVVVFDGGNHGVVPNAVNASTGVLSLNNKSDTVVLRDVQGAVRDRVDYGSIKAGVSWNRGPDFGRAALWAFHDGISGAAGASSPGRAWDGSEFGVEEEEIAVHLVVNEVMVDPTGTDATREYIEIVNVGATSAALLGYQLGDATLRSRHVFPAGTLEPGRALVVWDSGSHGEPTSFVASSGQLNLTNTGETVALFDDRGRLVDRLVLPAGAEGVAWNRNPDGAAGAGAAPHSTVQPGSNGSPGMRANGAAW